jgi:hypothetical protein
MGFSQLLDRTLWILLDQAFSVFIAFPLLGIVIVALIIAGVVQMRQQKPMFPIRFLVYLFLGTLVPASAALIGVIYYNTDNAFVSILLFIAVLVSIVLEIVLVIKERDRRLFIAAASSFFAIWSLMTVFVAAMSIYNDWL